MTDFGYPRVHRRTFLAGAAALSVALPAARRAAADDQPFSRSVVFERARALAAAPFAPPEPAVPEALANLSAQDYAAIRFREDHRLFADPPTGLAVELFHSGFIYTIPVEIFVVDGGVARKVAYDPALFSFGDIAPPAPDAKLEFAGFRILSPLNRPRC